MSHSDEKRDGNDAAILEPYIEFTEE
ncbi:MAG: hypothetical protein METHSR3v1_1450011 [Methanothrix sp.]|nr:MAG: hypothetical protein METHSR3v1_1450011 [Methanothrix sp.]